MKETRSGKYGRFMGGLIRQFASTIINRWEREHYIRIVRKRIEGFNPYSRTTREINHIEDPDFLNPEVMAVWIMEGLHLEYQADTSERAKEAILEVLKD
tara:strand:- start:1926 stop:2222 length:297 start_codon:yes stop_codon:yes gene_type:complete